MAKAVLTYTQNEVEEAIAQSLGVGDCDLVVRKRKGGRAVVVEIGTDAAIKAFAKAHDHDVRNIEMRVTKDDGVAAITAVVKDVTYNTVDAGEPIDTDEPESTPDSEPSGD